MEELLKQLVQSIEAGDITSAELGLGSGRRLVIRVESDETLRPYECPYCSIRAKSQHGLTRHMNANHPKEVAGKAA